MITKLIIKNFNDFHFFSIISSKYKKIIPYYFFRSLDILHPGKDKIHLELAIVIP